MVLAFLWLMQGPDSSAVAATRSELVHRNGRAPRAALATFTSTPPKLDGRLDDSVWTLAKPEDGFRRDVPSDGKPGHQNTEVRILYDREYLYVGARMFDDRPDLVSHRLSRRDSFANFNDVFFVLIDSYHDHRTQFVFGVTPAGERRDAISTGDTNGEFDLSWDPVWTAKTTIDSLGWTAEIRIPFSQLRFPQTPIQVWGIQFRRDIVRAGEAVDWNWSSKTEPGQVSKYGHLLGLENIPAPRRLEILPYVRTQAMATQGVASLDPFNHGTVTSATGGVDFKYGLSSDLTLNGTINPDFGQVEADPSVVNLTAFETFFEEHRPFFVEGSGIFGFGNGIAKNRFFYTRRIGKTPSLGTTDPNAAYTDVPISTSILGAAKVTGQTQSGWSIGALEALTGREYARLADPLGRALPRQPVEPLTNYGVLRARKDLNGGSSGFGLLATAVNRQIDDTAFSSLRSAAYTGGIDFFHRFKHNAYQLTGWVGGSYIRGDSSAILDAQTSSARYLQRPDQNYALLNRGARSLAGTAGAVQFEKANGEWVYTLNGNFLSPGFELNDLGFQTDADRVSFGGSLTHRWITPGPIFQGALVQVDAQQTLNFGGVNVIRNAFFSFNGTTNDFWTFGAHFGGKAHGYDDRATRGGPLMESPASWFAVAFAISDGRKAVAVAPQFSYNRDAQGGDSWTAASDLTIQTRGSVSLMVTPSYTHSHSTAFYVTQAADPTAAATLGGRYVFADLLQHTLSLTARLNWYVTPLLSVQYYAQPFVATGSYTGFKELAAPRTFDFRKYGENGSTIAFDGKANAFTVDPDGSGLAAPIGFANPDFKIRSLRSNLVVRWEYRPGSTLFLVWNQNRLNSATDPRFRALRDLGDIFSDNMQNVLLLKANYYLSF